MDGIDVLVVGEALVDFLPRRRGALRAAGGFDMRSGGAPANVAIGAARDGARVAFAGVVGADEFGHFLRGALEAAGVGVEGLRHSAERRTGLCFISLDAEGERSFHPGGGDADRLLGPQDIHPELAAAAGAVFFTTGSLREGRGVEAVLRLTDHAGGLVCCDPGFCPGHWGSAGQIRERVAAMIPRCDVFKVSAAEAEFFTGEREPRAVLRHLTDSGVKLAVVTLGPEGALWRAGDQEGHSPAPRAAVLDTTGAGDAFMAALMVALVRGEGTIQAPRPAIRAACAAGSEAVTRLGAV